MGRISELNRLLYRVLLKFQRSEYFVFWCVIREQDVPNYYHWVECPMWLSKMCEKLIDNEYTTVGQFDSDLKLICQNAKRFNRGNKYKWLRDLADQLYHQAHVYMKEILPVHYLQQTSAARRRASSATRSPGNAPFTPIRSSASNRDSASSPTSSDEDAGPLRVVTRSAEPPGASGVIPKTTPRSATPTDRAAPSAGRPSRRLRRRKDVDGPLSQQSKRYIDDQPSPSLHRHKRLRG